MDRHVAHDAALHALGELEDLAMKHDPKHLAVMYGTVIGYVLAYDPNALWDAILRYRASGGLRLPQEAVQPPADAESRPDHADQLAPPDEADELLECAVCGHWEQWHEDTPSVDHGFMATYIMRPM